MIIDGSNVGIGTSAPARRLHVAGTGRFDNHLYAYDDIRVNQNGEAASATSNSVTFAGARIRSTGNSHVFAADADQVFLVNRMTNDGALITFTAKETLKAQFPSAAQQSPTAVVTWPAGRVCLLKNVQTSPRGPC